MKHTPSYDRAASRRAVIGLLRTFLRPYAWRASLVIVLLISQSLANLYLPDLYGNIINNGVLSGNTSYIWRTGVVMLGITFAIGVTSVVIVYVASRVSVWATGDMRAAFYRQVRGFSAQEMSTFGIPTLITRNTNDVEQVQVFMEMALLMVFPAITTTVGGVIMALRESASLSLLLVVAVPLMALAIGLMIIKVVPLFRSMQIKLDRINEVVREQITGVRVIRAFGRTSSEQDRFRDANADLTANSLRAIRVLCLAAPIVTAILCLSSVGVIWFGGHLVNEGAMPLGNLGAFLAYILQILISVLIAASIIVQVPRAAASAERIQQVFDTVPAVSDPPSPVIPPRIRGDVEFRNVTFGYPGSERPVVRDLTFAIRPGQTTAIIGSIGSGKSTLINLIPRFIDATSGTVLVNEADVRGQAAEQLWSTIGLVPQTAYLFHGTVASNLRFGVPEATDEQLWRALSVAQASDFVASMPGQLDAPIDQGGTNISSGQRQRLSIARALLRRPRLYLLDDCFSALDAATEARLREALRDETRGATLIIVAQRISSIAHADQIIVLDAGSISGIGIHEELLATCPTYGEIVASQPAEDVAA
jgi:ATP-binding cassette subfamily B protein